MAEHAFILYGEQYRIVKYQQGVDEGGSDDKLAWRLKQRKLNYEFARMKLIWLYSGELELELTAEFSIIDKDQSSVIDPAFDAYENRDGEYEVFGEAVAETISMEI